MIRYVQPVSRRAAVGETAWVYAGLREEFGHAEPRVDHKLVTEYLDAEQNGEGDARLVAAVCWPALAAGRRIATGVAP